MTHVQHILAGTTNRLQILILALAARNFIWGSAISAVLTNNKSNSPDSSEQIQSYKYEIFTRRDCTHWLVSYEANKFTEPLHNGDFP